MFKIVAHRGTPQFAPENTLPAFTRALELGADAIELDVRLTADQVPVVFHYFYLDDHTSLSGPIFQHPWKELSQVKVRQPNHPEIAEARLSTLDEVLEALAGKIGLEIEIKGPEPICVELIAIILNNHPDAFENIEITSYETTLLERFKALLPGVPCDLLIPLNDPWMKPDVLAYTALQRGKLAGARAVHLHASQLSLDAVCAIRAGGCDVHAWGINDIQALNTAYNLQIERICTDNLQQALEFREEIRT